MAEVIYTVCALVSATCALLLAKNYLKTRARVILWVALSFGFIALNNIFACIDLVWLPQVDLAGGLIRNTLLAISGSVLITGLIWEMS